MFFHAFPVKFPGRCEFPSSVWAGVDLFIYLFGKDADLLLSQKLNVIDVALLNVRTVSRWLGAETQNSKLRLNYPPNPHPL